MLRATFAAALLLAVPVAAYAGDTAPAPDPARLKALVEKLVSFGTRHTLSSTTDPKRGIGAARNWGAAEFQRISKACGGCLTIERISDRFTGPRAPAGVISYSAVTDAPAPTSPASTRSLLKSSRASIRVS